MIAQLASDRYTVRAILGDVWRSQTGRLTQSIVGFEVFDTRTGQASINTWTLYRDRAEKWAANSNQCYAQFRAETKEFQL